MEVIKISNIFHPLVNTIGIGDLLLMSAKMVQVFKYNYFMSVCGGCTNTITVNYYRISFDNSLKIIYDALHNYDLWEFNIDLDSSTHQSHSYLDICARFMFRKYLLNIHLLEIPPFDNHTSDYMFKVTYNLLNALYPPWRDVLIAV